MQLKNLKQNILPKKSDVFSFGIIRNRLSKANALPQLAILSIITGALTSGVIILFILVIDEISKLFLTGSDNFENLSKVHAMLIPMLGGLIIGISMMLLRKTHREMGVMHVMKHLAKAHSQLPLLNALAQFLLGAIALICGLSGGREGPAIHLGAASSSILGHALGLPHNSIRILISCGVAAAVAASFNTPIAGVIFAMEVVMMEYTILSFVPVILASVSSIVIMRLVLGDFTFFSLPDIEFVSLLELPYIVLTGAIVGFVSAFFMNLTQFFARFEKKPIFYRAAIAGILTGLAGFTIPSVLGIGYDTIHLVLIGQFTIAWLVSFVIAKSLVSALCIGLGMPIGIIGPTLVIGASIGAIVGFLPGTLHPGNSSEIAFYVLIGMAAMMSAVLQAPLTALLTVVELTGSINIIMPAMLAIVTSTVIVSNLFKKNSIFVMRLSSQGVAYPPDPISQHLLRAGVSNIMHTQFLTLEEGSPIRLIKSHIEKAPSDPKDQLFIFDHTNKEDALILDTSTLVKIIDEQLHSENQLPSLLIEKYGSVTKNIDIRATLLEAKNLFEDGDADYLCVRSLTKKGGSLTQGIVKKEDLNSYMKKNNYSHSIS